MKRTYSLLAAILLFLLLFSGCTRPSAPTLPEADYPMNFLFSSGAGAWGTRLFLNEDGSFEGQFSDANLGESGKDYPNGTVYLCSFTGRFSISEKLDIHSYPLTLEEVTPDPDRLTGEEWIEDGILYVTAGPYGLYNDNIDGTMSRSFVLYAPTTPIFGLDEELLSWWPGRYETAQPETLSCWGLWNVEAGTAFFTELQTAN